jgi:hypothetical protein
MGHAARKRLLEHANAVWLLSGLGLAGAGWAWLQGSIMEYQISPWPQLPTQTCHAPTPGTCPPCFQTRLHPYQAPPDPPGDLPYLLDGRCALTAICSAVGWAHEVKKALSKQKVIEHVVCCIWARASYQMPVTKSIAPLPFYVD